MSSTTSDTGVTLRACILYPDLLNLYADRGNLMVLRDRCAWRRISFRLTTVGLGEELDGHGHDLYYIGGGQDRDQELCARDLVSSKRHALHAATDRGALILGICGGFQLLGHGYHTAHGRLPGLGLADFDTVAEPGERLIGNVAIRPQLSDHEGAQPCPPRVLAGFENHGGRTYLGTAQPLGRVVRGRGNNGKDGTEGVRAGPRGNVIGTYLHGPLLAGNAWLADWLIAQALRLPPAALPGLDDTLEEAGHAAALRAAGVATAPV